MFSIQHLKACVRALDGGTKHTNLQLRRFVNYLIQGGAYTYTFVVPETPPMSKNAQETCKLVVEQGLVDANKALIGLCKKWTFQKPHDRARTILNEYLDGRHAATLVPLEKQLDVAVMFQNQMPDVHFSTKLLLQSDTLVKRYIPQLFAKAIQHVDNLVELKVADPQSRIDDAVPGAKPQQVVLLAIVTGNDNSGGGGKGEPVTKGFGVSSTTTQQQDVESNIDPLLTTSQVVKMIQTNIPLNWAHNSCYLDTQIVPLLFDRASPYFTYNADNLFEFFTMIGHGDKLYLDQPGPRFTLMTRDTIQLLNALNPDKKVVFGATGSTGDFQNNITKNKLTPYIIPRAKWAREDIKHTCIAGPFAIVQCEEIDHPSPEIVRDFHLEHGGVHIRYRLHAISGVSGGHWQTLVNYQNQYYLVNVTSMGPKVSKTTLARFLARFQQLRIYYVADRLPTRTREQIESCNHMFKQLLQQKIRKDLSLADPDSLDPYTKKLFEFVGVDFEPMTLSELWNTLYPLFQSKPNTFSRQIEEYLRQTGQLS